jgi:hypothetical protein
MAEYIDLDTPLEAYRLRGNQRELISTTLRELLDFNKIPYTAADVVPVVRCKDCRHRDPEDHKCDCGGMERQGCPFPVDDDYFCAYGER